jgi:hypothetical protein
MVIIRYFEIAFENCCPSVREYSSKIYPHLCDQMLHVVVFGDSS